MTLSDLAKYSMTRSVAQSLCNSQASCRHHFNLCSDVQLQLHQMTTFSTCQCAWLTLLAELFLLRLSYVSIFQPKRFILIKA